MAKTNTKLFTLLLLVTVLSLFSSAEAKKSNSSSRISRSVKRFTKMLERVLKCSEMKQNCACVAQCGVQAKKEADILKQYRAARKCVKTCKKTKKETTCSMIGACRDYRLENQKAIMSLPTAPTSKSSALKSLLNSRLCMFKAKYTYHKIWSAKGCFQGL